MGAREGRVEKRPLWIVKGACTTNTPRELRAASSDFKPGTRSPGHLFFASTWRGRSFLPRFKRMDVACVNVNENP